MSPFDPPAPTALTALDIRMLYDRNPTEETRRMAWELWRLRRQVLDMREMLAEAAEKTHRAQVVYGIHRALFLTENEPCVREAQGFIQTKRAS